MNNYGIDRATQKKFQASFKRSKSNKEKARKLVLAKKILEDAGDKPNTKEQNKRLSEI